MNQYAIHYIPRFHCFTRLVAYIRAIDRDTAKLKFALSYEEECLEIIFIERIR